MKKMKILKLGQRAVIPVLFLFVMCGCNPMIYKKPLQDFKTANSEMEVVYFMQLELAKKAQVEKFITDRKRITWGKSAQQLNSDYLTKTSQKISDKRNEPILNQEILNLRKQAFQVLDSYAAILLALASNEDTNAIVTDINGVVKDMEALINHAKTLENLTDIAGKASAWIEPLSAATDVLIEITKLVSNVIREQAIKNTIVEADSSVREIIGILRSEARIAQREAIEKYNTIEDSLLTYLDKDFTDASTKRELLYNLSTASTIRQKLSETEDIRNIFDLALEAQASLVKKAAKQNYEEWLTHIRTFKEHVTSTKKAFIEIRREF